MNIEIEIVEVYPLERNDAKEQFRASVHAYLCDWQIDLRGIRLIKYKNAWCTFLPSQTGIDEEGKSVRFPVFSFMDRNKTAKLRDLIQEKAIEYVNNYILTGEKNEQRQ